MIKKLLGAVLSASVVAMSIAGCNAILDNTPGTLIVADLDETVGDPDGSPDRPVDGGTTEREAAADCPFGQHVCHGVCVSLTDPLYGCGDPSCDPCPSSHASTACQGRQCVVAACDKGYADCNTKAADGCEVDLSKAKSCGACNAACSEPAPLCAPSGASFQCTNGCTGDSPLRCGDVCVQPLTSVGHCGGCGKACPEVVNGTAGCTAGACTVTCKPQFHACRGECVAETDPTACGPTCTVCPVLANADATCTANACGFQCAMGFGNCDADVTNGCESPLASDPLNCGACGTSCNGQPCENGVCKLAP